MDLPSIVSRGAAASELELQRLESDLGRVLPPSLRDLLLVANGLETPSGARMFQAAEIAERQATLQVAAYAPGYLAIGDDGGDRVVLLAANGSVVTSDVGDMNPADGRLIAFTLAQWVEAGMSLGHEPEEPELVDVYLERAPPQGLPVLLLVKREVTPEMGTSELLKASRRAPVRLLRAVPFPHYLVRCRKVNVVSDCLGLRVVDSDQVVLMSSDYFGARRPP